MVMTATIRDECRAAWPPIALVGLSWLVLLSPAVAQNAVPGTGSVENEAARSADERPPSARAADDESRQGQAAATGLLILVGLALVSLVLVGVVAAWGFQTRRIARTPLAGGKQSEELWYLQQQAASGSSEPLTERDDANPAEQDPADAASTPGNRNPPDEARGE